MKMIKVLSVIAILSSSVAATATPMLAKALQEKEIIAVAEDKSISEVAATQLTDSLVRVSFTLIGMKGPDGSKVSFCKDVAFANGNVKSVSADIECN